MLRHIPAVEDPRVLVDAATRDDAAVFRLGDDRAMVATLDFFTPIVDDAYSFGAIAAANALSDLYAMGATPLFALNLVGWPRDPDVFPLLADTLRGGLDVAARAGAFVLGGHSIDDAEPKYGMVAIGEVHPDEIRRSTGARTGDRLVLTKPLGTGILSTALKRDAIREDDMREAVASMTTLNAGGASAVHALGAGVHAVTDVTGFGLLGHLGNMLAAGGLGARITAGALPVFDGVRELVAAGYVPGGTRRNLDAAAETTAWGTTEEVDRVVACDAQTSGGLLIAVDPAALDRLLRELEREGTPARALIGEVTESTGPRVTFVE